MYKHKNITRSIYTNSAQKTKSRDVPKNHNPIARGAQKLKNPGRPKKPQLYRPRRSKPLVGRKRPQKTSLLTMEHRRKYVAMGP